MTFQASFKTSTSILSHKGIETSDLPFALTATYSIGLIL
jgi:hypothetical protein